MSHCLHLSVRLACAPLLALIVFAGCDMAGDAGPAWTQVGAVAVFDYAPGPDSLRSFVVDRVPPHAKEPAGARLVQMTVTRAERWRDSDRVVVWSDAVPPGWDGTRFSPAGVPLPLHDAAITVDDDGVRVVVATQCIGNGWFGGSHGTLAWVRVPRQTGTLVEYGNCADGPGLTYDARRRETVTVPAGTFEALVIERPVYSGGRTVEYWSWAVGLVRLDVVNAEGVLRGRFVRAAG